MARSYSWWCCSLFMTVIWWGLLAVHTAYVVIQDQQQTHPYADVMYMIGVFGSVILPALVILAPQHLLFGDVNTSLRLCTEMVLYSALAWGFTIDGLCHDYSDHDEMMSVLLMMTYQIMIFTFVAAFDLTNIVTIPFTVLIMMSQLSIVFIGTEEELLSVAVSTVVSTAGAIFFVKIALAVNNERGGAQALMISRLREYPQAIFAALLAGPTLALVMSGIMFKLLQQPGLGVSWLIIMMAMRLMSYISVLVDMDVRRVCRRKFPRVTLEELADMIQADETLEIKVG